MLSFFRSIRRSLISEGKTSKYIRYAVREFLLIVAGILVALQVQTWNEGRKLEDDRRELIENLKADFQANHESLNTSVNRIGEILPNLDLFLEIAGNDTSGVEVETLQSLARSGFRAIDYQPALSAYETALSSGSYGLLEDSELEALFVDFEHHYSEFVGMSEIHDELNFTGKVADLRQNLGSLRVLTRGYEAQPEIFRLSDMEQRELLSSKEVYSIFETKRTIRLRQQSDLRSMKETTEQILAALESLD